MNLHLRSLARLVPLLAGAACTSPHATPPAESPAAAAESFSRALQEGDTAAAWALLSAGTQARADALAIRARVSADGGPESGRAMLFGGALPAGLIWARELSRDGGAATLSVSLDGGPARQFEAVSEGGGWKLSLDLGPDGPNR